jgi:hypothetical protein
MATFTSGGVQGIFYDLLGHKYGFCQTNKAYNMIRSEVKFFVYFVARMESYTIVVGAKLDE